MRRALALILVSLLGFVFSSCQKSPSPTGSSPPSENPLGPPTPQGDYYLIVHVKDWHRVNPIARATVYLNKPDNSMIAQAKTDEKGEVIFDNLNPSSYILIVKAPNYFTTKGYTATVYKGEHHASLHMVPFGGEMFSDRLWVLIKTNIERSQEIIAESECTIEDFEFGWPHYYSLKIPPGKTLAEMVDWFVWRPEVFRAGSYNDTYLFVSLYEVWSRASVRGATAYAVAGDFVISYTTRGRLDGLNEGVYYDIIVRAPGFFTAKTSNVKVRLGENYTSLSMVPFGVELYPEVFWVKFKTGVSSAKQQEVIAASGCSIVNGGPDFYTLKAPQGKGGKIFLADKVDWFAWRPEINRVGVYLPVHHD